MIVQACLNGAREAGFHPRLPLDAQTIARDGAACAAAGAAELHIHPRAQDGRESLAAVDETVLAVRRTCPGTLLGVSTGAWIEDDVQRTRAAVAGWKVLPDHASVNLAEPDAPAIMELLRGRGVGIEAGLASIADAERLLTLDRHGLVLRVLIEIGGQAADAARGVAGDVAGVLAQAELRRPILLHGFDGSVWPLVEMAHARRWSTRVGLEDGRHLPDGAEAHDNAALVAAAAALFSRSSADAASG